MRMLKLSWLPMLALIFVMNVSSVSACSPTPEAMELTLADRVDNAPIILVGTVIRTMQLSEEGQPFLYGYSAEIRVEQYLKGEGPEIVIINNFGYGADCMSYVEANYRRVFFASGNPDDQLGAEYLGVHDATWSADDEIVAEIEAMTNHSVAPYPLSISQQITRLFSFQLTWMRLALLGLVTLNLGGLFFARRKFSRRKPKQKRH